MRLLLDTCVWGKVADDLRDDGHDVDWVGNWPIDPGDEEILAKAHSEGRILVTLDKDFGELIIVHRMPHSGILRVVDIAARKQADVVRHVLTQHGDELQAGAVITAEKGRLRIRPPERSDADA
jgi:predicted nuclease of predicted toxin-antitoxin system